jgi:hypothetical protein
VYEKIGRDAEGLADLERVARDDAVEGYAEPDHAKRIHKSADPRNRRRALQVRGLEF